MGVMFYRVLLKVEDDSKSIDGHVFIEEMQVVDDSSKRPKHVLSAQFVFASDEHISYKFA